MDDGIVRRGGCACGAVRYQVRGEPTTAGLCHCADCREETGSAFLHYGDRPVEAEICLGSLVEAPPTGASQDDRDAG